MWPCGVHHQSVVHQQLLKTRQTPSPHTPSPTNDSAAAQRRSPTTGPPDASPPSSTSTTIGVFRNAPLSTAQRDVKRRRLVITSQNLPSLLTEQQHQQLMKQNVRMAGRSKSRSIIPKPRLRMIDELVGDDSVEIETSGSTCATTNSTSSHSCFDSTSSDDTNDMVTSSAPPERLMELATPPGEVNCDADADEACLTSTSRLAVAVMTASRSNPSPPPSRRTSSTSSPGSERPDTPPVRSPFISTSPPPQSSFPRRMFTRLRVTLSTLLQSIEQQQQMQQRQRQEDLEREYSDLGKRITVVFTSPPPEDLPGILKRPCSVPGSGRTLSAPTRSLSLSSSRQNGDSSPPAKSQESGDSHQSLGRRGRRIRTTSAPVGDDAPDLMTSAADDNVIDDDDDDDDDNSGSEDETDDDDIDSEGHCTERRKSVSWADRVETTHFKGNEPATAVHKTVKSKRKKQRKRDERSGRRRRHSSGDSRGSRSSSTSTTTPEDQMSPRDGSAKSSGDDTVSTSTSVAVTNEVKLEEGVSADIVEGGTPSPDGSANSLDSGIDHRHSTDTAKSDDSSAMSPVKSTLADDEDGFEPPDTALTWNDATEREKRAHKTTCPFSFVNDVMYEPDVD